MILAFFGGILYWTIVLYISIGFLISMPVTFFIAKKYFKAEALDTYAQEFNGNRNAAFAGTLLAAVIGFFFTIFAWGYYIAIDIADEANREEVE